MQLSFKSQIKLYRKYGLTEQKNEFIESIDRPMEISSE